MIWFTKFFLLESFFKKRNKKVLKDMTKEIKQIKEI